MVHKVELLVDDDTHMHLDIIILKAGGAIVCEDGTPYTFVKDSDELKRVLTQGVDKAWASGKEDADPSKEKK